jgi:UDP-2,3-diacylglucosamine pyrophosphatase LpxH
MKRKVDLVIISDIHLGTYGCHARELSNYLNSIEPGALILNGDFIDFWQFKKRYFPREHMQIIHQVLQFALDGTKVYYLTGNHDDSLRRFSSFVTGSFHLRDEMVIQLKGEKYWIFHGDIFDASVMYSPWIAKLGAKSYDLLILFNRFMNRSRERLGRPRLSFAAQVKKSVKKAVKYISDFEQTAIQMAIEKEYDYVVCGHIHKPQIRRVETSKGKVTYLNSGDWVENLTALEYCKGKWVLYEYDDSHYQEKVQTASASGNSFPEENGGWFQPDSAEQIFHHIVRKVERAQEKG